MNESGGSGPCDQNYDRNNPKSNKPAADMSEGDWSAIRDRLSHPYPEHNAEQQLTDQTVQPTSNDNWARIFGRYIIVGGLVLGLAIPELAHSVRPLLIPLLVSSLVLALLQVDLGKLRDYSRSYSMVLGLLFILLILTPIFVTLEAKVVLVPYGLPVPIAEGMILASMAPPLLAAPAIAFLLGLDSVLALVIALVAHILTPITIALLTQWLSGYDFVLDVFELLKRLALLIGSGFLIGLMLRRFKFVKRATESRQGTAVIDGLSVITLTLLALALMDGVTELAIMEPTFVILAFICGFILNPVLQFLGAALFVKSGFRKSLTVGLLAGYRNTGLLIAVLADSVDPMVLTFLAIVQIPTFLMPMISTPVLRKVRKVGFEAA